MKDALLNMTIFFLAVASICQTIQIVRLRTQIRTMNVQLSELLGQTATLSHEVRGVSEKCGS